MAPDGKPLRPEFRGGFEGSRDDEFPQTGGTIGPRLHKL